MAFEFGVFHEFQRRAGQTDAEAFAESFAQVDAAELWGLDVLWLAELHFVPQRSVASAPLVLASALAARTRRMKIGIAVQVLPLSHPLHIAEDVATASPTARAAIGQRLIDITYDEVIEEFAVYGTPEAVTDRLLELREALGYRRSRCG